MALSENYESYCYYVLTHCSNYGKLEKESNFYYPIQRSKIHSKIEENLINSFMQTEIRKP